VLRLVVSAQTALGRLAASIGRAHFAAIDGLAAAPANLHDYSRALAPWHAVRPARRAILLTHRFCTEKAFAQSSQVHTWL
jgi:hypothetical protein